MASSSGDSTVEQLGMTRASTLYAPMNDLNPRTFFGGVQEASVAIRCELAVRVPCDHTHPRTVVVCGQITVFLADSRRLQSLKA